MAEKETQIGKAKMKQLPQRPISFKLKDKSVKTKHLDDKIITPDKLSDDAEVYFKAAFQKAIDDLQNQIDSLTIHGMAVSNEFGLDQHIGISQKTLTESFNEIWIMFEEITHETLRGFNMVVAPQYFISETSKMISIDVVPLRSTSLLDSVYITVNGVKVEGSDKENVPNAHYEVELSETSTIRVDAQVLGVPYHREQVVTRYNEFFIGCGSVYTDVMDGTPAHTVDIRGGMRLAKNVTAEDNDYIFIIIGSSLYDGFIRADMNGIEIPFDVDATTLEGYVILKSQNTYSAGTYNIDING